MYGPDKSQRAEFYRYKGETARIEAAKAKTPALRVAYLKLAIEWDQLAGISAESADAAA